MHNKAMEVTISALTFLVNTTIGCYIIWLGNILIHPFFSATPAAGDVVKGYIIICVGLVILLTSVIYLIKKTFITYAVSVVTVITATIVWIIFIASSDAVLFLITYVVVFAPHVFYKHSRMRGNER